MKNRYKHIHFEAGCFNGVFSCLTNKGDMELGVVGPGAWKRITFRPAELTEFAAGCLEDIIHFIGQLEGKHTKEENDDDEDGPCPCGSGVVMGTCWKCGREIGRIL